MGIINKTAITLTTAISLSLPTCAQGESMQQYIDQLMAKMTLQEKLGQLNQLPAGEIQTGAPQDTNVGKQIMNGEIGSVFNIKGRQQIRDLQQLAVEKSRLGIPLLVGMDVIHGYETQYPIPLGMSCTWDIPAIERAARLTAIEATANGIGWTFSPMVDICIDPRWGRQAEGAGEDPFLGSRIAEAMIRGYQTDDLSGEESLLACVKHFALYGAAESGRDYNTVDMSHVRMYNQYFPPYKAAIKAGVGTVMSSFNVVDYVPATANKWLLTDVLRKEWGFNGFVVTDYASIDEMKSHGMGEKADNAIRALKAGTDMDMVSKAFIQTLEQSLKEGKVTMAEIDNACRRILEVKYKMGLFKNPYKYLNNKHPERVTYTTESKDFARKLTAESFVLLKNANSLLPLQKKGTIALIGPLAETRTDISGTWAVAQDASKYKTLREGLADAVKGKATLLCTQGCNVTDDKHVQRIVAEGHDNTMIPWIENEEQEARKAMDIARQADVIVCAMGECAWMSGEGTSRSDLTMPAPQRRILERLATLGKPIVLLNFAGRATVLSWEHANIPAIMNVWFGSECADAVADVLFGDNQPSGRLTVSMPKATGQVPLYYNQLHTGRNVADEAEDYVIFNSNYMDVRNGALYPFGYGLSYTQFAYSPVTLSAESMSADGSLTASVTVTNTGDRDGDEVVQLYIHDVAASISRPDKELKGFQRIHLAKGESKKVDFTISADLLSFYNSELQETVEPGKFEVFIGENCKTKNKNVFNLVKNK